MLLCKEEKSPRVSLKLNDVRSRFPIQQAQVREDRVAG